MVNWRKMSSMYSPFFQFLFVVLSAFSMFGQAGSEAGRADEWLKKGLEAMKQSRFADAQSAFEKAVEADPSGIPAHLQLAAAVLRQLHPGPRSSVANLELVQKAERELRRVLELDAMNRDSIVTLAAMEYQLGIEAADPAQRATRLEDAAHLYGRIANTPYLDNKSILAALAQVDYARSSPELTQAVARSGRNANDAGPIRDEALRKGLKEKYGGIIDEGIASATAALDIDPAYVPAMNWMNLLLRERALLRDGDAESARDMQRANEWERKSRPALTAATTQAAGYNRLVADLTEAIQRKPDFGSAYFARGKTYLTLHQYANAVQDFTKAIELKPGDAAIAYLNRAEAYSAMNQREQEIADLTAYIRMKPDDGSGYLRRGTSYRSTGNCDRAVKDYTEAIRLHVVPDAYSGRSACRKQLGDLEGAAADQKVFDELLAKQNAPAKLPTPTIVAPPEVPNPKGSSIGPRSGEGPGSGVYRVGEGVSPPTVLWKIEPEYSEEARLAKWQGTVALSVVVDENGEPRDVKVARSLGLGLDQKAIEAVGRWVFKPGRKEGKPVSVLATIEVNFRLL
jgi:TonB family protein